MADGIYKMTCKEFFRKLNARSLELWQDVLASEADDTAFNVFVPYENWEEAKKRVHFVSSIVKKYQKYSFSSLQVQVFVHNLCTRLTKLEAQKNQVSMFPEDNREVCEEIEEIEQIKQIIKNFPEFFNEMYYSKR